MTTQLHKILLAFAKELEASVTEKVTTRLRESYVADITAIVKDCLNKNELYLNSGDGWIAIQDASSKYRIGRKAIGEMCRLFKEGTFKIERKWIGRHNMLNEKQFLAAFDQKARKTKPKFLNRKKAA